AASHTSWRRQLAHNLPGTAASQLSPFFLWPVDFLNWDVDANHGSELVCLRDQRVEISTRSSIRRGIGPHDGFLDLGWLARRPLPKTRHSRSDAGCADALCFSFSSRGLDAIRYTALHRSSHCVEWHCPWL